MNPSGRSPSAFYNELDPYPAAWIRNLVAAGHVAPGVVSERSIRDLRVEDIVDADGRPATQAHFFAGIAGWSYALRLAGWPDDEPVWTGSCPCQPFSDAGEQRGFDDERHLWPDLFRLIVARRPEWFFGEQVASPLGYAWFDVVRSDLEGAGYAVGMAVLPAAGVGAPHLRHRIFFGARRLADPAVGGRGEGRSARGGPAGSDGSRPADRGDVRRVADDDDDRREVLRGSALLDGVGAAQRHDADRRGPARGVEHAARGGAPAAQLAGRGAGPVGAGGARLVADRVGAGLEGLAGHGRDGDEPGWLDALAARPASPRGATGDAWSDVEWISCRDGKARPALARSVLLAHGLPAGVAVLCPSGAFPARTEMLKGFGNAIVPQVAAAFVRAFVTTGPRRTWPGWLSPALPDNLHRSIP